MKKKIKLKSLLYKSNHLSYGQLLLNNNVVLTVRSDLFNKDIYSKKPKNIGELIRLYNNNTISYKTLIFFIKKRNKTIDVKYDYSFLKTLTELSWESGIIKNNNTKTNIITFNSN